MSKEAMKLALEALIAEYHMENSSFARRVDCIFKEALSEQPAQRTWVGLTDGERQRTTDAIRALVAEKRAKDET